MLEWSFTKLYTDLYVSMKLKCTQNKQMVENYSRSHYENTPIQTYRKFHL